MTEEEIRGKLLLPFLNDLGFTPAQISLENQFTIRLGKNEKAIKGRSDILCTKDGKNLFIIELKSDEISISEEDIAQGISYARSLVDNIAPFTIITNGRSTRIFDSITKLELTGKKISEYAEMVNKGLTLSADEEVKLRYEALVNFVSLSSENLKTFCEGQILDRMGSIVGSFDSPRSKFVRELYLQRSDLQASFKNFIDGDGKVFAIVGSAGVGKTNAICSLAMQIIESEFAFFYNAAIIHKSPLEHMSYDLDGFFSSKSAASLVLKKLDELARTINKNVILFIDGIDESVNPHLYLELSELALAVRSLNKVKICISCKSNIWGNILKQNGTPTHLFEELLKVHGSRSELHNYPGYLLEDFSDEELKALVPLYRSVFGFKGDFSIKLLNELKNGFFLRIFSEVYSNKQIPDEINDRNLIKAYLNQSFEKTVIGWETAVRYLSRIGKVLVDYDYEKFDGFYDDGIDLQRLFDHLNFPLEEKFPEDLFSRSILTRSRKEESINISFYYSKIRDYIICFHSYRLNQLNDEEFGNVLPEFYKNYIGRSAIHFYLLTAKDSHRSALAKFKTEKALSYVSAYSSFLKEHFNNFRDLFNPKTTGEIGIVFPKDIVRKDGYALFPLKDPSADRIIYEEIDKFFSTHYYDSRMWELGILSVSGSHESLLSAYQNKKVRKDIFSQLTEIISKGKIKIYNADSLLMEQVSLIVYYYGKELGFKDKIEDWYLPRYEAIYPIDLEDLRTRIFRFRAYEYFRRQYIPGNPIPQLVDEAIANKTEIPKLNITGDFPPIEELSTIVDFLISRGYSKLEMHNLPYPDISVNNAQELCRHAQKNDLRFVRCSQYSSTQAKLYIEAFFKSLEISYKEMVDHFFPTYKSRFRFFSTLPHEYFFYIDESDILKWGAYGCRSSKSGTTEVNFRDRPVGESPRRDEGISILHGFSLDGILHCDYSHELKTVDGLNTGKMDQFCILRTWLFKLLKNDIRELLKENGEYI